VINGIRKILLKPIRVEKGKALHCRRRLFYPPGRRIQSFHGK
jgi:hypothetical protein